VLESLESAVNGTVVGGRPYVNFRKGSFINDVTYFSSDVIYECPQSNIEQVWER